MLHKVLTQVCHRLNRCSISSTRHSALFINGPKATDNFVYVTPHVDFNEIVKDNHNLKENLRKRNSTIDLDKVINLWSIYEELQHRKTEMETQKNEIYKQMNKLFQTEPDSTETQKLKVQMSLVKDNLQKLKVPLWSAEEMAMLELLKIPNSIHKLTPDTQSEIIHSYLDQPNNNKDHLKIGHDQDLLGLKKNENYYLKGDAALFELGAKFYFTNIFKQHEFVQFSNPDFVKSLIVEGCGEDHCDPDSTFILHHDDATEVKANSRLHLVGGGSLPSFVSYYTKNILYAKALPLKYFSMGRQYVPSPQIEDNLFHVSQSSVIQFFSAAKTLEQADVIFDQIIKLIKTSYDQFGVHYRMRLVPASELSMWESLHLSVEMYSTSMKRYIEIANIAFSGDYISKRLMFMYTENKETKFPFIVSGMMLSVPRFLGCFLEQDATFSIPEPFKIENWSL